MLQTVKNLPAMWETWVLSISWEDPLEEEMVNHSSILAWEICPWGCKESDMTEHHYLEILLERERKGK